MLGGYGGGRRCWGEEGGRRYGDGGGSMRCWGDGGGRSNGVMGMVGEVEMVGVIGMVGVVGVWEWCAGRASRMWNGVSGNW